MAGKREKQTVQEIVTAQVIAGLERGEIPWRRPWDALEARNFVTGHRYSGVNVLLCASYCSANSYKLPLFASYNQITRVGGKVNKGAHGHVIVFNKRAERKVENDAGELELKTYYLLRFYNCFNIEQTDIDASKYASMAVHEPVYTAEELLHRREPDIKHGGGRACYSPAQDRIKLPAMGTFSNVEDYYGTAYHELTHWTGHESRLDRFAPDNYKGSEAYSFEELIAEIGANMLSFEAGIKTAVGDNSQAYINHWLAALKNDSRLIIRAAGAAERARKFCMNGEPVVEAEPEPVKADEITTPALEGALTKAGQLAFAFGGWRGQGWPPAAEGRHTSGRCHKCNVRYVWKGKPRLKDAYCPTCGDKLHQTTHIFKGLSVLETPAEHIS